jgi:tRNA nucleotidyltransferase (CCA-adding enzyme)
MRVASALWYVRAGTGGDALASCVRGLYRRMLRSAFRDPLTIADLAVDGEDLQREGIPRGPLLGRILSALLERVLEDPSRNTREWLLGEARRLYREWMDDSGVQDDE